MITVFNVFWILSPDSIADHRPWSVTWRTRTRAPRATAALPHIRSSAPARGSGWWRALQPLGLGPSGTLATHDAWLSPWGSVYPTPRHPISFWWPLYHIQNFAGDIMSLCHSFLPSLSLQSFSATASSSARAFLCQETHASLHFYCTFVISSERVCPARQERHHHHFCIPRSFFLALLD